MCKQLTQAKLSTIQFYSLKGSMSIKAEKVERVELDNSNHFSAELAKLQAKVAELERTRLDYERLQETLRQREAQLLQAQKMEAVGRLAGGIAHDFNNLLTAIMGYAELVSGGLNLEKNLVQEDLQDLQKTAEQAALLTRQLLTFSRPRQIEPSVLDLNNALSEIEKLLRRLIGEDVELQTKADPASALVLIDHGQFDQIIMNLAINARDAMPSGGKLSVEIRKVFLDEDYQALHNQCLKAGHYALLAVTDNGIGMNPLTIANIFDPFFTTKEPGKGTSLGLATVFNIVQQNNGVILVYSELGVGTTFKIYLPVAPESYLLESPRSTIVFNTELLTGSETVLLVEDDDSVRSFARRVLETAGYNVLEACDGQVAYQLAEKQVAKIDILLTDILLPKMGGRELALRLKNNHPNLKVMCMSGYTDWTVIHHGLLDSQDLFLQKPFTTNHLLSKVRQVLDVK